MTVPEAVLLFIAALIAGALNSVAGGGSFISFPALLATGVPSVNANMTNTVALWPGSVASVGAYRTELSRQNPRVVLLLALISFAGGLFGAELLIRTPKETFDRLLPWLLLFATLIFIFGPNFSKWLRARFGGRRKAGQDALEAATVTLRGAVLTAALQFFISTYGGYFGGGIGILMLASLSLMGMTNIHTMNALKTVLASCINGIAVVRFVVAGSIVWPEAIVMIVAAIIGGYGGAAIAQKLNPTFVRRFVMVVAIGMTIYFFVRGV